MDQQPENRSFSKQIRVFWLILLTPIIGIGLMLWAASIGMLGSLPTFEELENPQSDLATEILFADGEVMKTFYVQNRTQANFEELSPYLIQALVATEDERFYNHSGIDFFGLIRAVVFVGSKGGASTITQQLAKMLFHDPPDSFIGRLQQKFKEWIIAVKLERQYTKEEIICMYLNQLDFVYNAVGIKSAAKVYFKKQPSELKIEEAAMFVGMAKNPILYNPLRNEKSALTRRNVVLHQMKKNDLLSEHEYDSLKRLPIKLNYTKVDHKEGLAPHFREILRAKVHDILNEKYQDGKYKIAKDTKGTVPYNLYRDGLKIYTTIDSRMQRYAEEAVAKHLGEELQPAFFQDTRARRLAPFDDSLSTEEITQIMVSAIHTTSRYRVSTGRECGNCGRGWKYIQEIKKDGINYFKCTSEDCGEEWKSLSEKEIRAVFRTPVPMKVFSWKGEIDTIMTPYDSIRYYKSFLNTGVLSIEPITGHVKAWVGGIDFKHFSYDNVIQSKRQVGSTIKPIIYAVGIQTGKEPCQEITNTPYTFHKGTKWHLDENWTPKNSFIEFDGMVSLKYGLANSMNNVTAWIMRELGSPEPVIELAKRMGIHNELPATPSLCLGVADLTLHEMVGAYCTFVNKGIWIDPIFITHIEDKDGKVLWENDAKTREAMDEQTAYAMISLMKGTVDGVYNKYNPKWKVSGTAMRLRSDTLNRSYAGFRNPIAAKTGTTQNQSDGWFMGMTPELVTGVWVGAENRSIHFKNIVLGQGANTALPIWGYYMKSVYRDSDLNYSRADFERPEGKLRFEVDCDNYVGGSNVGDTQEDLDF